jgi:hypothetical protein
MAGRRSRREGVWRRFFLSLNGQRRRLLQGRQLRRASAGSQGL